MEYRTTVTVAAPAETVWAVLAELRAWPTWTPTVDEVVAEAAGPAPGLPVTVRQPGRRPVTYTVDVVEPGRRFRWYNQAPSVRQVADHVVTATGPRACTVELSFAMTGLLGGLFGRLGAGRIREFVDTEAASLRDRAQQPAAAG